jgi:hypothetical protein
MPQYMTVHRAPGLLQEHWEENCVGVNASKRMTMKQAYVNLSSGFIVTIYEAASREDLVEEFEELGLPFEEIQEIQYSQSHAEMVEMLQRTGRS